MEGYGGFQQMYYTITRQLSLPPSSPKRAQSCDSRIFPAVVQQITQKTTRAEAADAASARFIKACV